MATDPNGGGASAGGWQRPDAPLGTLIFRAGLLTEEQLEQALAESVASGRRLGQVLLQWGWLQESDLSRLLAGQRGLDFVELSGRGVDPEAVKLLPEETARLHRALAIGVEDGVPVVAIEDPRDDAAMRAVCAALGCEARFVVATRGDLFAALDRTFGPSPSTRQADPAPAAPKSKPKPKPSAAPGFRVVLRLSDGDTIDLGSFDEELEAGARAEELIERLDSGWLLVAGRFVNPAAVVSVDIVLDGRR